MGTSDNTRKMLEDCSTWKHSWFRATSSCIEKSFSAACELKIGTCAGTCACFCRGGCSACARNPKPYSAVGRFITFNALHRLTASRKAAGRNSQLHVQGTAMKEFGDPVQCTALIDMRRGIGCSPLAVPSIVNFLQKACIKVHMPQLPCKPLGVPNPALPGPEALNRALNPKP